MNKKWAVDRKLRIQSKKGIPSKRRLNQWLPSKRKTYLSVNKLQQRYLRIEKRTSLWLDQKSRRKAKRVVRSTTWPRESSKTSCLQARLLIQSLMLTSRLRLSIILMSPLPHDNQAPSRDPRFKRLAKGRWMICSTLSGSKKTVCKNKSPKKTTRAVTKDMGRVATTTSCLRIRRRS